MVCLPGTINGVSFYCKHIITKTINQANVYDIATCWNEESGESLLVDGKIQHQIINLTSLKHFTIRKLRIGFWMAKRISDLNSWNICLNKSYSGY